MHKLFVRLVASGLLAGSLGATALADGSSIELTGPGSTNVVTSSNSNSAQFRLNNRVALGNFNHQFAQTGGVFVCGNTVVHGSGLGSGSAFNSNSGRNNVMLENSGGMTPFGFLGGGSGGGGTIFLTGPHSANVISSSNSNRFSSTTTNNVRANNSSTQTARSGGVLVTGNTLVTGVGGSGNAANFNSGTNTVGISNSSPSWNGSSWGSSGGGGGGGSISTTGPGSFNLIRSNNSSRSTQSTTNNVTATNTNRQSASSGPVVISGNTVVSGVGGSGDATNENMGQNDVRINNN
ncbi:MAG TPA: hypothetical protein VGH44_01610 [Candidatus Saccharimonadia bacterium]|jgi:hypothetical protein